MSFEEIASRSGCERNGREPFSSVLASGYEGRSVGGFGSLFPTSRRFPVPDRRTRSGRRGQGERRRVGWRCRFVLGGPTTRDDRPEDSVDGPEPDTSPGPVLRRVGPPLLLYHALILAGAYLVVLGYVDHSAGYEGAGAILIASGVALLAAVLAWSARLSRRAAHPSAVPVLRASGMEQPGPERSRWLCVRCGRRTDRPAFSCPDCGGSLVRSA